MESAETYARAIRAAMAYTGQTQHDLAKKMGIHEDTLGRKLRTPRTFTLGDIFALRVKGDSMSPRIMDGDIVLVHQQETAEDGDLVIAMINGEATCKVLKRTHGVVTLVPFNAAYPPFIYSQQEAEELHILGKVVESRHEWR